MLAYPEIPGPAKAPLGRPCIAFCKYDGSNLRFEWGPKQGWHKFGTRTQLFDTGTPVYGPAIPFFLEHIGPFVESQIRRQRRYRDIGRIVAFAEWFGPNSFAGKHTEGDPMDLELFDVSLYKRGFMPPREFVDAFWGLSHVARVVYEGNLNQSFIDNVRKGVYPVWEGVVAKGDGWMVKIKTEAYLRKLREVFGGGWQQYGE